MDCQSDSYKNKLFLVFREFLKTRPEPTECSRGRVPSPSLKAQTNPTVLIDQAVAVHWKF